MNKVILTGNLGADPDMRSTKNGTSVVSFSLATRGYGKDAPSDWHRVEAWEKTADFVNEYFKKGSGMLVEGRIKYETYEKDGETKYATKIIAERVEFMGGKKDEAEDF